MFITLPNSLLPLPNRPRQGLPCLRPWFLSLLILRVQRLIICPFPYSFRVYRIAYVGSLKKNEIGCPDKRVWALWPPPCAWAQEANWADIGSSRKVGPHEQIANKRRGNHLIKNNDSRSDLGPRRKLRRARFIGKSYVQFQAKERFKDDCRQN